MWRELEFRPGTISEQSLETLPLLLQTSAVIKVSPAIPHLWVNSETGVLAIEDHARKLTLKQMVLDGYEAISGSRYVPQQTPPVPPTPNPSFPSWQSLKIQIEGKLSGMSDEELCLLMTDQAAFAQELHTWSKETGAGKQYIQAHKDSLQAAQSNKDLVAVRSNHKICNCRQMSLTGLAITL